MSDYQVGKDIHDLETRIARIEDVLNKNRDFAGSWNITEADVPCPEKLDIKFVDPDGNPVIERTGRALMYPDSRELDVYLSGGGERWNTGFPKWENLSSYSGNVWLQRKDNGDRIVFHYIQTGSHTNCQIAFGDTSRQWSEARNSYVCSYGFGRTALEGRVTFSSWAKFRFADGYGYDVGRWTCFC